MPVPLFFGSAGLCVLLGSGRGQGTWHPCTGGGPKGGVGAPAAEPSQPPLFCGCPDTKDWERCGILSAAFRPYMVISLHYSHGSFKTALLPSL